MASVGILGSHMAGDFFLGVDLLVTSMLVNFLLMCLSVLVLPRRNPTLAREVRVFRSRAVQVPLAGIGAILLTTLLAVHIHKDWTASMDAWYFHSTPLWILVMGVASVIYVTEMRKLRRSGVDVVARFRELPPE